MFIPFFVSLATAFIGALLTAEVPSPTPSPEIPVVEQATQSPPPSPEVSSTPVPLYTISRVIDGDTLEIQLAEKKETVRLIGIDTPETVDPRRPVQCLGQEASNKLKQLAEGKSAEVVADSTQGDKGKYSRLLRYIAVDGKDLGLQMIEQGYAQEYTYDEPYLKQAEYKNAQKQAQDNNLGLWNPASCPAPTPTPSPSPKPTPTPNVISSPKPVASPVTTQVAPAQPPTTSGFTCNCKKTCPTMTCAEAQFQLNSCGCGARDADKDGIACDSQCQ